MPSAPRSSSSAIGGPPVGVVLEQLDVKTVQAAGGANVKRAFADLLDGGNARQRRQEAKVIGKVRLGTGERFAIGGKDEPGLGTRRGRAGLEGGERGGDGARLAHGHVNIAGLQHAAEVGFVGPASAQSLERGVLVAEGLQEGKGKLVPIKR